MFKFINRIKKMISLVFLSLMLSVLMTSPARAQGTIEEYLAYIMQNTYKTAYGVLAILNALMLPDETDTTTNLQTNFVTNYNLLYNFQKQKLDLQTVLTKDFLTDSGTRDVPPVDYVNDFTFQSMLNNPYYKPDPRVLLQKKTPNIPLNYIKNISGLNISHTTPSDAWGGTDKDKANYQNFYTTVSAIQTYNGYILSDLYLDAINQNALSKQQDNLIAQASSPTWFVQIASENIGVVLRQILMYNSQTFVLLNQLLQTQKQMLSAQAMTNTLLVLGNQFTETQLVTRARGTGT